MKKISQWILKTAGWTLIDSAPKEKKCVICVAPHTSNWDFIIGKLYYSAVGRKASFFMKKEWFFFPLGYFFKAIGGVPIDRSKKNSITDQLAERFNRLKEFHLAITPEGTRKPNAEWKKGLYYIAQKASVPIQLAYIDYTKKVVGIATNFHITGDVETDIQKIKMFYKDIKGKIPQNFLI